MRILGISDGRNPSATLVDGDRVVARAVLSTVSQYGVPWDTVTAVMESVGASLDSVDKVAIVGRSTPTLAQRQRQMDAPIGLIRRTLFGANGALRWGDGRVSDWFTEQLMSHGYTGTQVSMVDTHRALSMGAYVGQSHSRALSIVVQPNADGLLLSVSCAIGSQMDQVWSQRSDRISADYLPRVFQALGGEFPHDVSTFLTTGTVVDTVLVQHLTQRMSFDGTGVRYRGSGDIHLGESMTEALQSVDSAVAKASMYAHVSHTLSSLLSHHVAHNGRGIVVLSGDIFESADLVADMGLVPGVVSVWSPPMAGLASLGAAAETAGLGPTDDVMDPIILGGIKEEKPNG